MRWLTSRLARAKRSAAGSTPRFAGTDSVGVAYQAIAAFVISVLGLMVMGGVWLTSSASAHQIDAKVQVANETNPDITRAEPVPDPQSYSTGLDAKTAKNSEDEWRRKSGSVFTPRDSEVSRNAVRAQVNAALGDQLARDRANQLHATGEKIDVAAATAVRDVRDKALQADLAKVRSEASRIAKEKKAALERLKQMRSKMGSGKGVSAKDLEGIEAAGSSTTPLPRGTYRVGAHWGMRGYWARWHTGQDFAAPIGTPIRAVTNGIVGKPTSGGWAGINVVIHHGNGGSTLYAHMSRRVVSPGSYVKAGDVIGYVGVTGRTFGAHLHFEYYAPGATPGDVYASSNPIRFLASLGVRP